MTVLLSGPAGRDVSVAESETSAHPGPELGHASFPRVLRDQRKTIVVALVLAVAAYWILGQLGEWTMAGCVAGGVGLGLLNHLATEFWLLRLITSGEQPTRLLGHDGEVQHAAASAACALGDRDGREPALHQLGATGQRLGAGALLEGGPGRGG